MKLIDQNTIFKIEGVAVTYIVYSRLQYKKMNIKKALLFFRLHIPVSPFFVASHRLNPAAVNIFNCDIIKILIRN